MNLEVGSKFGVPIQEGMIGLFFEDINYAADGGLYAEMIENRSFEFLKAHGDKNDYYVTYDGGYGWHAYPDEQNVTLQYVMGSPLSNENPHYMRLTAKKGCGFSNKAYDGIYLKKDMEYRLTFFARCLKFSGNFKVSIEKDGVIYASAVITNTAGTDATYNRFYKYEAILKATHSIREANFHLCLSEDGIVEFDFISLFPMDAVAGIFRKDLFELVKELKPGFIRFPGGCIVEGNTLANRYQFKDSLKEPWNRKNNWNRWAVHGNCEENNFESKYSHYNQSMGLGYYEYFLLCELIGAKPLPVINVGFACQYQSEEMISIDSLEFEQYIQEAIDLIEFANGDPTTKWGAVRVKMGHPEPFHLSVIGVG